MLLLLLLSQHFCIVSTFIYTNHSFYSRLVFLWLQRGIQRVLCVPCHVCLLRQGQHCLQGPRQVTSQQNFHPILWLIATILWINVWSSCNLQVLQGVKWRRKRACWKADGISGFFLISNVLLLLWFPHHQDKGFFFF